MIKRQTAFEICETQPVSLERAGGALYFEGYASVFYDGTEKTEYRPLPHVREHINKTAFDEVVRSAENIKAFYNHSPDFELGSTKLNTLFLRIDAKGLRYTIPYDDSDPDHTKVKRKIEKGIAKGASFKALGQMTIERDGNRYIRTIETVEKLDEISIVNDPAYTGSQAIIRSQLAEYEEIYKRIAHSKTI